MERGIIEQKETKITKGKGALSEKSLRVRSHRRDKIGVLPGCESLRFLRYLLFPTMHPLFQKADALSYAAIGAAIEVHRLKGAGLLESIYEKCLVRELNLRKITVVNQRKVQIEYKGLVFDEPLGFDVLIENCLLLELKSVQEILPIHKAQLFSYMKLLNIPLGLIVNFHELKLTDGIVRMILPGANH